MNNQKIALITGANRGLGYETAKQLGEKKVTVIVGARQRSAAKEAVAALKENGIDAYAIQLDITSASDRSAAFAFIEENFGRLDILINNAGVVPDDFMTHPLNVQVSNKELEYVFNTNFFSVVHLTKDMLPLLKRSSSARIVNVSSIMGSLTLQSMENSPFSAFRSLSYNASKTSLNLFTILLSEELKGTNIKVNSAHPGWVKTEMGTQAAPMEIEDGAKTSVALALMDEDGPTGKFIHAGESLPW